MSFPAPGIHHNVSERDYHAAPLASKSNLWRFCKSPHKWKHGPPVTVTEAMIFGSLVDCLLTSPEAFAADFALSPYPNFKKGEAKLWKKEQEASGRRVIMEKPTSKTKLACLTHGKAAAESVRNHALAASILEGAQMQVSVVLDYKAEHGNIRTKGRIDFVPRAPDMLADLKTDNDISRIETSLFDRGYHGQAALYLDLWNGATGEQRDRFSLIYVESSPPWEVRVIELDADAIAAGRRWYQGALELWAKCHRDNHFPSPYEDEIKTVSLPKWHREEEV